MRFFAAISWSGVCLDCLDASFVGSVSDSFNSMHSGHSVIQALLESRVMKFLLRIEFKSFSMMRNLTAGSQSEKDDLDELIAF